MSGNACNKVALIELLLDRFCGICSKTPCHFKESDLTMYADDHQMCTMGKSYGVVEARLMMQGHLAFNMVQG